MVVITSFSIFIVEKWLGYCVTAIASNPSPYVYSARTQVFLLKLVVYGLTLLINRQCVVADGFRTSTANVNARGPERRDHDFQQEKCKNRNERDGQVEE